MHKAGRMAHFDCAPGFEIDGAETILCTSGRWKQDMPICISKKIKILCFSLREQNNKSRTHLSTFRGWLHRFTKTFKWQCYA